MKKFFETLWNVVLWGQWTKFWDWIKLSHSSSDDASSKRLWGGIILAVDLFVFVMFSWGKFPKDIWPVVYPAWFALLFVGGGMISLGVIEKVASLISTVRLARAGFGPDILKAPANGQAPPPDLHAPEQEQAGAQ